MKYLYFLLLTILLSIPLQAAGPETESLVSLNYLINRDDDIELDIVELGWQMGNYNQDAFLNPFVDFNVGFSVSDYGPDFYVSIVPGLKMELLSKRDDFVFLAMEFGAGLLLGGSDGEKAQKSVVAKMAYSIGYKGFYLRLLANIYSDNFPAPATGGIGIGYAF